MARTSWLARRIGYGGGLWKRDFYSLPTGLEGFDCRYTIVYFSIVIISLDESLTFFFYWTIYIHFFFCCVILRFRKACSFRKELESKITQHREREKKTIRRMKQSSPFSQLYRVKKYFQPCLSSFFFFFSSNRTFRA